MSDKVIYLASPYSHPDPAVRQKRYEEACEYVLEQYRSKGIVIFSPIVYAHPLSLQYGDVPWDANFWGKFNLAMLDRCDELMVYCIPGWDISVGVGIEREFAHRNDIPVKMVLDVHDPYCGDETNKS